MTSHIVPGHRLIFDYDAQPKEEVNVCNLCGDEVGLFIEQRDRYGFNVETAACDCGLIFLDPRMTKEAYAKFYQGPYRALVSAFHGREINAETIQREQAEYAKDLTKFLVTFIDRVGTILDVGGSTGVVGGTLGRFYNSRVTVLDPSTEELSKAAAAGHSCRLGMIEDFEPNGEQWELVLFCQTADHVLDLMGTLRKLRDCITPSGWLYVDIVDFDKSRTIKIDHPYYLTERTMQRYLESVGLGVVSVRYYEDNLHVGFLCKRLG